MLDALKEWWIGAICILIDVIFSSTLFVMKIISTLIVFDVSVPSALSTFTWNSDFISALLYFFPVTFFALFLSSIIFIELVSIVAIPLVRSFMDLL